MYISYKEFCERVLKTIKTGDDFYVDLLSNIIQNPGRYCGIFRLSNAKTKLLQNVTQSNEIKFGDLIEEIVTFMVEKLGYKNLSKHLGRDENGDALEADQIFKDSKYLYFVEMKIRDDHDSTKKRGQFSNFVKKIKLIRNKYPAEKIKASMWFVDDGLSKNKNYYLLEMRKNNFKNCELSLYYGNEFFNILDDGRIAWAELVEVLTKYRIQNADKIFHIPDFGTSKEILNALLKLDDKNWNKLISNNKQYVLLREELFSNGNNLKIASKKRNRSRT